MFWRQQGRYCKPCRCNSSALPAWIRQRWPRRPANVRWNLICELPTLVILPVAHGLCHEFRGVSCLLGMLSSHTPNGMAVNVPLTSIALNWLAMKTLKAPGKSPYFLPWQCFCTACLNSSTVTSPSWKREDIPYWNPKDDARDSEINPLGEEGFLSLCDVVTVCLGNWRCSFDIHM